MALQVGARGDLRGTLQECPRPVYVKQVVGQRLADEAPAGLRLQGDRDVGVAARQRDDLLDGDQLDRQIAVCRREARQPPGQKEVPEPPPAN
ncbi:MAG: hypothetical protein WDM81_10905 [Rhizomicrobium sp.]